MSRGFTIKGVHVSDGSKSDDRCELDSHADTGCAGSNCIWMDDGESGEYATVHSFSDESKPFEKIPIGTVATAWVNQETSETVILVFNQWLYFGDRLAHSLVCPNQLRSNGITVSDVPKQFDQNSFHAIDVPDENLTIPLHLKGVISFFDSHKPSEEELETCRHVTMTSDTPWNPHDHSFAEQELAVQSKVSVVHKNGDRNDNDGYESPDDVSRFHSDGYDTIHVPAELLSDDVLADRLVSAVNVAADDFRGDGLDGYLDESLYGVDDESRHVSSMSTKEKASVLTKEVLARRWGIGMNTASRTMKATTQRGIRTFVHPSDRRIPTKRPYLDYPYLRKKKMYTDTLIAAVKSRRGNTVAQVWADGLGYSLFYPLESKALAYTTVPMMVQDLNAIPAVIVSDGSKEQKSSEFRNEVNRIRSRQHTTEPYSQWQNASEREIREIKSGIKRFTLRENSPFKLWDFCGEYVSAIRRLTAHDIPGLNGLSPEENIHARTPDISAYAQYEWYEAVWYVDPPGGIKPRKKLGRWIGVAEKVGGPMTYWILPKSCDPIARSSVFPLTEDDLLSSNVNSQLKELDDSIESKIGNKVKAQDMDDELGPFAEIPLDLFEGDDLKAEPSDPEMAMPEADEFSSPEIFDQYLNAQVLLDRGGTSQLGTVKRRSKDPSGDPVGRHNSNPLLDSREYQVEFPDGSIDVLTANAIAESIYSQVDDEGRSHAILSEIIDHRKSGAAVNIDDSYIPGTNQRRRTTKGWELLANMKDGSSIWVSLKDFKEAYPIEVAEYAVNNKIASEAAFCWWVPHVLKKRDRIIKKVKTRYFKRTHKFGIELPKSVPEALEIDKKTGTDFWRRAIEKEMKNVHVAFEIREDGSIPVGFREITCHLVFDIKSDTLARKARFVAGGHLTDPPKESTYSSVVSRDSVRLFFLLAALNDLDVLACDCQNAYINATTSERVWFRGGPEMGPDEGKVIVIVRALYGLKSSGAQWRSHMANTLRNGGFKSCPADPDVWIRAAVKPDGTKIYEYVLCYVDDVIFQGLDPNGFMDYLRRSYKLKDGSVKEPDTYLGADVSHYELSDGTRAWSLSSDTYVKRAVQEVERELEQSGECLKSKVVSPFASGYRPEFDSSPELNERLSSYYASLMGVLRWCIELGRVDIIVEVGLLARFQANPRVGHLEQMFHVFAYLKKYNRSRLVFDWTEPELDESVFKQCDWKDYYPDAKEPIPPNAPEPRGKSVTTTAFVDADHAGCQLTRRSHTGVLIFVNRAPILWFSKRQATVESSTFGSEVLAMRQCIDMIEGLRYKLRMMGVPIDGSTKVYCDNESVVKSTTRPESTLKKKHTAIAYHRAREAQAAGHVSIAWIDGRLNLSDAFTKVTVGERRRYLYSRILY